MTNGKLCKHRHLLCLVFQFRAASLHQGDHKFLAVSATKPTATATHTNMADQCKSKSGCEARLHFSKGFRCLFVLWTVSTKKTRLVKVAYQQNIYWLPSQGQRTFPRETCHGKLFKESPLTHSHGQVKLVKAKLAKKKTC